MVFTLWILVNFQAYTSVFAYFSIYYLLFRYSEGESMKIIGRFTPCRGSEQV